MFSINLAIKFGSGEISVYQKGVGIIAKEPSILAVSGNGKNSSVKAIGKRAEKLIYSKTEDLSVLQPIVNAEIVDEKMAILLFTEILHNVLQNKSFVSHISALVAVPCGLNYEQLNKIKKVIKASGVSKITFVSNAVCVRKMFDFEENEPIAVVDIGKNVTDITVLNDFEIYSGRTYFVGGVDMDKSISTFIQDNHNLEVLDVTSEEIKNEISSLYERDTCTTKFIGIDTDNHFRKDDITASEVTLAITSIYDSILNSCKDVINSLDKNTSARIYKNGVVFVGGASCIPGLYEYVSKKFDANIIVPENPIDIVLLGAVKLLNTTEEFPIIDF